MKILDSNIKIKSKNVINDDNSSVEDVINNMKNNITKLIPVELYKTAAGSSGTITLNDDASKYEYLEVFYGADGTEYSTKVRSNKSFSTPCHAVRESDVGINLYAANWTISGNKITFNKASNMYMGSDNVIHSYGQNAYIKIYEVIGYKEV